MPTLSRALPAPRAQAERLIDLGLADIAGVSAALLLDAADRVRRPGALLVIDPALVPPSALAPLLRRGSKPGFVVADMIDVDDFGPIVDLPRGPVYLVHDVDRGDAMAGWSPDEALPAFAAAGRTPLTLTEGQHWLLQQPDALERNHCFMTIGSRRRKLDGTLDSRTPALWISNGTGRDGAINRDAPKVGWCWAGNRHRWLGFASAARRSAIGPGSAAGAGEPAVQPTG